MSYGWVYLLKQIGGGSSQNVYVVTGTVKTDIATWEVTTAICVRPIEKDDVSGAGLSYLTRLS